LADSVENYCLKSFEAFQTGVKLLDFGVAKFAVEGKVAVGGVGGGTAGH
jgi:hypothetical protein